MSHHETPYGRPVHYFWNTFCFLLLYRYYMYNRILLNIIFEHGTLPLNYFANAGIYNRYRWIATTLFLLVLFSTIILLLLLLLLLFPYLFLNRPNHAPMGRIASQGWFLKRKGQFRKLAVGVTRMNVLNDLSQLIIPIVGRGLDLLWRRRKVLPFGFPRLAVATEMNKVPMGRCLVKERSLVGTPIVSRIFHSLRQARARSEDRLRGFRLDQSSTAIGFQNVQTKHRNGGAMKPRPIIQQSLIGKIPMKGPIGRMPGGGVVDRTIVERVPLGKAGPVLRQDVSPPKDWIPMRIRQGYRLLFPAVDNGLPFVVVSWCEDKQSSMRRFRKPRQDDIRLQRTSSSSSSSTIRSIRRSRSRRILRKLKQIVQTAEGHDIGIQIHDAGIVRQLQNPKLFQLRIVKIVADQRGQIADFYRIGIAIGIAIVVVIDAEPLQIRGGELSRRGGIPRLCKLYQNDNIGLTTTTTTTATTAMSGAQIPRGHHNIVQVIPIRQGSRRIATRNQKGIRPFLLLLLLVAAVVVAVGRIMKGFVGLVLGVEQRRLFPIGGSVVAIQLLLLKLLLLKTRLQLNGNISKQ
jgi:hypothetical protein